MIGETMDLSGLSDADARKRYAFNLSLGDAKAVLKTSDGLQENPSAKGYPLQSQNEWGVGFDDTFEMRNSDKSPQDGALSFEEKNLASQQLAYDREDAAREWNDAAANPSPISVEQSRQAQNFVNSVFYNYDQSSIAGAKGDIREGLDRDQDGKFTNADLVQLAALDGDASTVTSRDFETALKPEVTVDLDGVDGTVASIKDGSFSQDMQTLLDSLGGDGAE